MKSKWNGFGQRALAIASPFLAIIVAFTCLELSSGVVMAQDSETPEREFEDFDYNNFDRSTNIDNEWMPLKPGMRFVYVGTTMDDGEPVPHRVVITITDLTRVIDGVRTVVSWDLDYSADQLVEAELAFFAQDNDGNVWRMGEYPEEYEDGEFVAASCWIAGIEDAKAGIAMKGEPRLGMPSYSQGWAPATGFTDRGRVHQMVPKICVPLDCYEDVLVIAETSQAEPDAHQLKYWARGVGNIRVGWKGEGEKTQENLELVEMIQLDSETLAEVRAKALELEKHAYEISNHVYSLMPPVVLLAQIEEERQAARNSMIGFGLTAAIGIFLLLQVFFRSWRLATVIFLTLPIALVGGVLAGFAGGGIISFGSIVGFVAVLGIAVRNCITLIARYQNLERHEGETFGPGLVLRGTRERFAPILMTAAITGVAFLPLALFGDIPGHEIVNPMAVVILGGLVTATLLNLYVVPALYLRFGGSREPDLELLPVKDEEVKVLDEEVTGFDEEVTVVDEETTVIHEEEVLDVMSRTHDAFSSSAFLTRFHEFSRRRHLIEERDKIIAAVSGGVDSVVLLDLLAKEQDALGLKIIVAHFNHQLQGCEADEDEQHVTQLARHYGFDFYVERANTAKYAQHNKLGVREAARRLRYEFLDKLLLSSGFEKIATAHNADANAETILLNLFRGAGVLGLSGIPVYREDKKIVRPLLFAQRSEIEQYAAQDRLTFRTLESSNETDDYPCNSIRHHILPRAKEDVNPNVVQTLHRSAELFRELDDFLTYSARQSLESMIAKKGDEELQLVTSRLHSNPILLQQYIVRLAAEQFTHRKLEYEQVNAILELMEGLTGSWVAISKEYVVFRDRENLIMRKTEPATDLKITVRPNHTYEFDKFRFASEVIEVEHPWLKVDLSVMKSISLNSCKNTEFVDTDKIQGEELVLRTWNAGDSFVPLGMKTTKKINDFFLDSKIPPYEKRDIPILETKSGEVVWVCGHSIDDRFKVTDETKRVMKLEFSGSLSKSNEKNEKKDNHPAKKEEY